MKTVTGYVRVSTRTQEFDGMSLNSQKAMIQAWAESNGYRIGTIYQDVMSGAKSYRPGLELALSDLGKDDVLVVYSLSRLARSTRHTLEIAERLEKVEADLVSLSEKIDTTSAAGRMIFRMLAVLAEFERDLVSERTKDVLAHKRGKGERLGRPAYGSKVDNGELKSVDTEQVVLTTARELHQNGLSLRGIATALASKGLVARNGSIFQPTQIKRMLKCTCVHMRCTRPSR